MQISKAKSRAIGLLFACASTAALCYASYHAGHRKGGFEAFQETREYLNDVKKSLADANARAEQSQTLANSLQNQEGASLAAVYQEGLSTGIGAERYCEILALPKTDKDTTAKSAEILKSFEGAFGFSPPCLSKDFAQQLYTLSVGSMLKNFSH